MNGFPKLLKQIIVVPSQTIWSSTVLLGFILFITFNVFLIRLNPLASIDPESLPSVHSWVWWATQEYLREKKAPDIVLLGTSLLMHPISRVDADYLNKDLDYVLNHHARYLESVISKRISPDGSDPISCYNYALPGGFVSDYYLITRTMLQPPRKPNVVVVDLCLRDFIDNLVVCPGASPAYQYLSRFDPFDDIVDLTLPKLWERWDYLLGKYVYLWKKKPDLQMLLAHESSTIFNPINDLYCAQSPLDKLEFTRRLPGQKSEVAVGDWITHPHPPEVFLDNSDEYRKRYAQPNLEFFNSQKIFLDKLLELCNKNQIKVILVNMPVTPMNIALMPPGSYDHYTQMIRAEKNKWQCAYLDLNASGKFGYTNFIDTVHLDGTGGKKFVEMLVDKMFSDPQLSQALKANNTAVTTEKSKQGNIALKSAPI
jgi:hypothetical protein